MYPPGRDNHTGQYAPLATDTESAAAAFDINDTYDSSPPLKQRIASLREHPLFRPIAISLCFLLAISVFKLLYSNQTVSPVVPTETQTSRPIVLPKPPTEIDSAVWHKDAFNFSGTKPAYLDTPLDKPLVIRLAIITRVDAFERRQAVREAVLAGVPTKDVQIDYRFFVAKPKDGVEGLTTKLRLVRENHMYNDVVMLDEFHDVSYRISEKRFSALKWTNSVPQDQYDYSMTMDSDTFCRFGALARRLKYMHPDSNPREKPIMVGRMGEHMVYFENTIPDGNENDDDEDHYVRGPWYKYPIGVGYMLSSNLANTILSINPPVAHHINYPSDDVMIGSWVGALKYYLDPDAVFNTTDHGPVSDQLVHPKPLLPYVVDTQIYDDQTGWLDVKGDSETEKPIGWDSVCVHRMNIDQMFSFRKLDAFKGEWDEVPV